MRRYEARAFMSLYIDDRIKELAEPICCIEYARLCREQRAYRRARGFPEESPEPKQNTNRFYYGLLSDMATVELPSQRTRDLKL